MKCNYPDAYDVVKGECKCWHADELSECRLDPMINAMTAGKFKLKCRVEIRSAFELLDGICDPVLNLQERREIKNCNKEFSVPWIFTNSVLIKLDHGKGRVIHTLAHKASTSANAQTFPA